MVDSCKHVNRIKACMDLGLLRPERWNCVVCSTTESVWACLHCPNIACGRYNEEHALRHHRDTGHPLSIEINEKFVFCYVCDDYILNDNAAGDIKILRMALDAVAAQNFSALTNCSLRSRLLRSQAANPRQKAHNLLQADLTYTALTLHRRSLLSWSLRLWHTALLRKRPPPPAATKPAAASRRSSQGGGRAAAASKSAAAVLIPPGTTGLRNLGNTCYINSVVQILSHTDSLAAYFIDQLTLNGAKLQPPPPPPAVATTPEPQPCPPRRSQLRRLTSTECLESVESVPPPPTTAAATAGGLSGGCHQPPSCVRTSEAIAYAAEDGPTGTLVEELHALFRVLWSGRRAVVSPQGLLTCVWRQVPFFRGYRQQDAQEFLCELLDRLQKELCQAKMDIVARTFQGTYLSTVKCLQCNRCSQTEDIFLDISLAFPESCHTGEQTECQLGELLRLFSRETEIEERSYLCDRCNRSPVSQRVKRVPQYSKARQQLRIKRLPRVLRLHLKRFRWIGRAREKICTRVCFASQLDVSCLLPDEPGADTAPVAAASAAVPSGCGYHLTGVVVHHGRGFQSGHYTAFCYNRATGTWLHCNDACVQPSSLDEVLSSQAYILFYTQDEGSSPEPAAASLPHHLQQQISHHRPTSSGDSSDSATDPNLPYKRRRTSTRRHPIDE